jgi:shikimate dehydrogenase
MTMISGKTRLLCVVGHPTEHSLSPFIQNTFIEAAGLDYSYLAFDVTKQSLGVFVAAVKTLNIAGFNVTMPLKADIIPYLAAFGESTKDLGAVNTVINHGGDLIGHNTDGSGFLRSLKYKGYDFARKNALILGGGGAAKAISHALTRRGLSVTSVTRERGEQGFRYELLAEKAANCDFLINATPLGMAGYEEFADLRFVEALPGDALVYDIVYHPKDTKLLGAAASRGLKTIGGLSLLVFQAARAFEHFTGVAPTVETIEKVMSAIG